MYRIYCDDTLMYSDQAVDIKYKLIDARLSMEDNVAGSLSITLPPTNICYNMIIKMFSHITVYRDNEKLWGGRPLSEEIDFYNNKTFFCEGELGYLNDTYQPLDEYHNLTLREYITRLLDVHNSKIVANNQYIPLAGNGPPDAAFETEQELYYGPQNAADLYGEEVINSQLFGSDVDPDYYNSHTTNVYPDADPNYWGSGSDESPTGNKWADVGDVDHQRILFKLGCHVDHDLANPISTAGDNANYCTSIFHYTISDNTNKIGLLKADTYSYTAYGETVGSNRRYRYRILYRKARGIEPGDTVTTHSIPSNTYTTDAQSTVYSSNCPTLEDDEFCIEVRHYGTDKVMDYTDLNNLNALFNKFYWFVGDPSGTVTGDGPLTLYDNTMLYDGPYDVGDVLNQRIRFRLGAHAGSDPNEPFDVVNNKGILSSVCKYNITEKTGSKIKLLFDCRAYDEEHNATTSLRYMYRVIWIKTKNIAEDETPIAQATSWILAGSETTYKFDGVGGRPSMQNADLVIEIKRSGDVAMTYEDFNNVNALMNRFTWRRDDDTSLVDPYDGDPLVDASFKYTDEVYRGLEFEEGDGTRSLNKSLKLEPTYDETDIPVLTRNTADPWADYNAELGQFRQDGFSSIEDSVIKLTYNPVTFGNINMDARPVIFWSQDRFERFRGNLSSHTDISMPSVGDFSTLLPCTRVLNNFRFAYTPILQTSSGFWVLHSEHVDQYIANLMEKCYNAGGMDYNRFLSYDKQGYLVSNLFIHDIIIAIASVQSSTQTTDLNNKVKLSKYVGVYGSLHILRQRAQGEVIRQSEEGGSSGGSSQNSKYQQELQRFRSDPHALGQYENAVVNLTYNSMFFNINMDARPSIKWNVATINRFASELQSWGVTVQEGDVSTSMPQTGIWRDYRLIYTPIVQTPYGARLASRAAIEEYMAMMVDQSYANGMINTEELRSRDNTGLYIGDVYIHHAIGGVARVGQDSDLLRDLAIMPYVGRFGTLCMLRKDPEASGKLYSGHQDKRIYPGIITVSDEDLYESYNPDDPTDETTKQQFEYRYTYYETTLECISKIGEYVKGHLRVRTGEDGKLYLDYLKDYINTSSQVINFGENLFDYTQNYDLSNLCTVLLPLGAKKDRSDVVGKAMNVNWRPRSIISSKGEIYYGQCFCVSMRYKVVPKYKYTWVNNVTGKTENKEKTNYIKYTGSQVNGYIMYAFIDQQGNKLSSKKASGTSNSDIESIRDMVITIPSLPTGQDHIYFVFAYYENIDGSSRYHGSCQFFRDEGYTNDGTKLIDTEYMRSYGNEISSGMIIDDDHFDTVAAFGDDYVVSDPIPVNEKSVYYYTARQNKGYGMYAIKDRNYRLMTNTAHMANSGNGYTDLEKHKIETPAGAAFLYLGALRAHYLDAVLYNDGRRFKDNGEVQNYDPPEDYVTVKDANDGSIYVKNTALINKYGWIERSVTWDKIKTPSKLKEKAEEYFLKNTFETSVLECKAMDLHLANVNTAAINMLDKVRCVSLQHGLDRYFPVTKMEIPLLNVAEQTFTLGESNPQDTISASSATNDTTLFKQIAEQPSPGALLKSAKANATEIMNARSNGYVSVTPSEIAIMDTPDRDTCTRLWRMNVNGIGYSSHGYYGSMDVAMTMDGSIVADKISTGFLSADRIRGGILTLGGYDNNNGVFELKTARANTVVRMDQTGCKMIGQLTTISKVKTPEEALRDGKQNFAYVDINKGIISGGAAHLTADIDATQTQLQSKDYWEKYEVGLDNIDWANSVEKTRIELYNSIGKWGYSTTYENDGGTNLPMGLVMYANDVFKVLTGTPAENGVNEAENPFSNGVLNNGQYSTLFLSRTDFTLHTMNGNNLLACVDYNPLGADESGFSANADGDPYYSFLQGQTLNIYTSATRHEDVINNVAYYRGGGVALRAHNGSILLESETLWVREAKNTNDVIAGGYEGNRPHAYRAVQGKTIEVSLLTDFSSSALTFKKQAITIRNGIIVDIIDLGSTMVYVSTSGGSSSGGSSGSGEFEPVPTSPDDQWGSGT